jgi:6,7-dimethyl-8-ribityllumazine synthase
MSSSSGGFWPGEGPEDDTAEEDMEVAEAEPELADEESAGLEPADSELEPEPELEPEDELEPGPVIGHRPGEIDVPAGIAVIEGAPFGNDRSVGIVVARVNSEISNGLLESALEALAAAGVEQDRITVMPVPGAFELAIGAMSLIKTRRYSSVIALGCVIRGETPHFDFIAAEAASGLQLAGLESGFPVAFGVLTVDTIEQAEARLGKGGEAARAALEMADIFSQIREQWRATR